MILFCILVTLSKTKLDAQLNANGHYSFWIDCIWMVDVQLLMCWPQIPFNASKVLRVIRLYIFSVPTALNTRVLNPNQNNCPISLWCVIVKWRSIYLSRLCPFDVGYSPPHGPSKSSYLWLILPMPYQAVEIGWSSCQRVTKWFIWWMAYPM